MLALWNGRIGIQWNGSRKKWITFNASLSTGEFFKAFHNSFEEAGTGWVVVSLWKSENTSSKMQAPQTVVFWLEARKYQKEIQNDPEVKCRNVSKCWTPSTRNWREIIFLWGSSNFPFMIEFETIVSALKIWI
jgi:hypothetical protein